MATKLHPVFVERLMATVRTLREVHKKEIRTGMAYFDLVSWGTDGFPKLQCNSTACATGWATVACPNQGLSLEKTGLSPAHGILNIVYRMPTKFGLPGLVLMGWEACERFFGLNSNQARYLFVHAAYRSLGETSARTVANRIAKFVRDGKHNTKEYHDGN